MRAAALTSIMARQRPRTPTAPQHRALVGGLFLRAFRSTSTSSCASSGAGSDDVTSIRQTFSATKAIEYRLVGDAIVESRPPATTLERTATAYLDGVAYFLPKGAVAPFWDIVASR